MREGLGFLKTGQPGRAAECFQAASTQLAQQDDPGLVDALLNQGRALYSAGRIHEAEQCFAQAADKAPSLAHEAWARVLQESGNPLEALEHIQRACLASPGNAVLLARLAAIQCEAGRLNEARVTISTATSLVPRDPHVRMAEGNILWQCGQREEAAESYRRVLDENPHHEHALTKLGALLLGRGAFSEAEALLGKALSLNPDDPALMLHHAHALAYLGQREAALERLCATQSAPLSPGSLLQRAHLNLLLGRHAECIHDCNQLIPAMPDGAAGYVLRAGALASQGFISAAKTDLELALMRSKDNPLSYVNLGKIHLHLGDPVGARNLCETARAIDPGNPHVIAFLNDLANLPTPQANTSPLKRRKFADSAQELTRPA